MAEVAVTYGDRDTVVLRGGEKELVAPHDGDPDAVLDLIIDILEDKATKAQRKTLGIQEDDDDG